MGARTYLALVMFAWVSIMLFIGSLGAFLGAPESHAPLFITLILTSIATLSISALSVSLQKIKDEEESTQRATATFVFINSAGVLVGIVTDLSEVLETRSTKEINNGLTYLYGRVSDQSIPIWLYAALLAVVLVLGTMIVIRGARLLSEDRRVSEAELQRVGAYAMSLLALWILVCLRWHKLPYGAEIIARGWTLSLYAILVAVTVWFYGRWSVRGIALFVRALAALQNGLVAVIRRPLTWKIILITILAVAGGYLLATIARYILAVVVSALGQAEVGMSAEARSYLVESSRGAMVRAITLVSWFLVTVLIAVCLWFVGLAVKHGVSVSISALWRTMKRVKVPSFKLTLLPSIGFALSSWLTIGQKIARFLKYPALFVGTLMCP